MDKHRCGTFLRIESTGSIKLRLTRSTNSPGESLIQSACPDLLNLNSTVRGEAKRARRKPSAAANTMGLRSFISPTFRKRYRLILKILQQTLLSRSTRFVKALYGSR